MLRDLGLSDISDALYCHWGDMPTPFRFAKVEWIPDQQEMPEWEGSANARRPDAQARASPSRWNEENDVYLSGRMSKMCSLLMLNEREEEIIAEVCECSRKCGLSH